MVGNRITTQARLLLAELSEAGIELVSRGKRLACRPKSAVTQELVERIRAHKQELLEILWTGCTDDAELSARLRLMTADEIAHFEQRVAERRAAGESEAGLGWRALVDMRIRFGHWGSPAMWTSSASVAA